MSDVKKLGIKWFPKDHECPLNYLKFTYNGSPLGARIFSKPAAIRLLDRAMIRSGDGSPETREKLSKKIQSYKRIQKNETLFDQYVGISIEYNETMDGLGRILDAQPEATIFDDLMRHTPNYYSGVAKEVFQKAIRTGRIGPYPVPMN